MAGKLPLEIQKGESFRLEFTPTSVDTSVIPNVSTVWDLTGVEGVMTIYKSNESKTVLATLSTANGKMVLNGDAEPTAICVLPLDEVQLLPNGRHEYEIIIGTQDPLGTETILSGSLVVSGIGL